MWRLQDPPVCLVPPLAAIDWEVRFRVFSRQTLRKRILKELAVASDDFSLPVQALEAIRRCQAEILPSADRALAMPFYVTPPQNDLSPNLSTPLEFYSADPSRCPKTRLYVRLTSRRLDPKVPNRNFEWFEDL